MKLKKLSDLVYYLPHEEKRDRPLLSYINGTKIKLAIDAGSSLEHVKLFYKELKDHNLELPDLTILTHWHWDHTFGVHAINGLSITSKKTYQYLAAEQKQILKEEYIKQLHSDLHGFKEEYENKTINIKLPDIQYQEELVLDLGGISAFIKEVDAPHSLDSTIVYIKEE
ncbi:MAG: MBL fold metallo-hydrolase [Erysipelotrichales bacterium]